ncbi:3-oxoadipate enol-lactonase [Salipiger thiooxidans]|uniref:3-oxoadipate enol-lactonase n=1 Tax=Salipiger thiooxidans TaxID=282683 RepID=UPI001CFB761F|nr:3-oxoadipate enol-lactonase [Salipiger thiooxidans]
MPEFLAANGRLHHVHFRRGTGPRAIVFANSLGTDLRIWDNVVELLPPELSLLRIDKSGHGLSEGGAKAIADLATDLAAVMDLLTLRGALICGVSVGGMIAQALAAQRPDLVGGLVLCNTSHRIGTEAGWNDRITALDAAGLEPMADEILERWFSPQLLRDAPALVAGYRMMLTRTPIAGYRAVCAAIRDADLTEAVPRIGCPTLCIAGDQDQATPPQVVRATANLLPAAHFVCFEQVGHLPCIEAPDRLAACLCDHLERMS